MNPENDETLNYSKSYDIPDSEEFAQEKASENALESWKFKFIYQYQTANDEQKREMIEKLKEDGKDDKFIIDLIDEATDTYVPQRKR